MPLFKPFKVKSDILQENNNKLFRFKFTWEIESIELKGCFNYLYKLPKLKIKNFQKVMLFNEFRMNLEKFYLK